MMMTVSMDKECSPCLNQVERSLPQMDSLEWGYTQEIVVLPQNEALNSPIATIPSQTCIRLALEKLQCFEVVQHQFQHWGIVLNNAIALQPSNPAFGIECDQTVLMGAPRSGWLEVTFEHPVRRVSAWVASSRRIVLCAYNQTGEEVAQAQMPVSSSRRSIKSVLPHAQLSVEGDAISRVTFYTFDSQLVVDHFILEF